VGLHARRANGSWRVGGSGEGRDARLPEERGGPAAAEVAAGSGAKAAASAVAREGAPARDVAAAPLRAASRAHEQLSGRQIATLEAAANADESVL
jgi:hypothetical protein